MCQELDEYDSFYKGNIESVGYSSIYVKRNGQKRDGCGIFYKPDRWPSILSSFLNLYIYKWKNAKLSDEIICIIWGDLLVIS